MRYRQPSQLQEDRATERIGGNVYRLHRNIPLEEVPWTEDVYRLADLWRWLKWRKKAPKDPAYFMTHAEEYAEEYAASRLWKGEEV